MQRIAALAAVLAISLTPLVGGTALAHGDKEVIVAPLGPKAGETITVKGGGIGENREIEVRVVGQGADIDLGELEAEEDGDFSGEFQLPAALKPGIYQVRAIGDEAIETQVTIAAGAAGSASPAATTESSTAVTMTSEAAESAKQRPPGEAAVLVTLFGAIAALGLLFARTGHRERASKPA